MKVPMTSQRSNRRKSKSPLSVQCTSRTAILVFALVLCAGASIYWVVTQVGALVARGSSLSSPIRRHDTRRPAPEVASVPDDLRKLGRDVVGIQAQIRKVAESGKAAARGPIFSQQYFLPRSESGSRSATHSQTCSPSPSITHYSGTTAALKPIYDATVLADAPLITIGIPSIPRAGGEDYLSRTLHYIGAQCASLASASDWFSSLAAQDPGLLSRNCLASGPNPLRIRVIAMNNRRLPSNFARSTASVDAALNAALVSGGHPVWARAAQQMCTDSTACSARSVGEHLLISSDIATMSARIVGNFSSRLPFVTFVQNGRPVADEGDDVGEPNVPGARVRLQTRDVCDLLDVAGAIAGTDAHDALYMFMEDDFRLCPRGLEAVAFLLAKARALGLDWNAVRVSFGLNGAVIRAADLPVLAAYMRQHIRRRPPDHLFVEWFAGETPQSREHKRGRPHAAFRYNLLEHFGLASSLRVKASPLYAYCFDELNSGVVFEVEAFKAAECPADDLWPCPQTPPAGQPQPVHAVPFAALKAAARSDSVQSWAARG